MSKINKTDGKAPQNTLVESKFYQGTDRRIRGQRVDVSFPVSISHDGVLIQGYVEALNVSWSGILLATNFPLNNGDIVDLEFILPDSDLVTHVRGKVVRTAEALEPDAPVIMGVLFTEIDTNVNRMLQGFVLTHLSDT